MFYGNKKYLKTDADVYSMFMKHERLKNIHVYVEEDRVAPPIPFRMPCDEFNQALPNVISLKIVGDLKENNMVSITGMVAGGTVDVSIVQWYKTSSATPNLENGLQEISMSSNKKEFHLSIDLVGFYIVAKFIPMAEDGRAGEPTFVVSEKRVESAVNTQKKNVQGKNKNKRVASLKIGEKLPIRFYNNRVVGENYNFWSRHLGRIMCDHNICPIKVKAWQEINELHKEHMWIAAKGGKEGNPPDIRKLFFKTRKKGEKLVEPETQNKYAKIVETIQSEPSLSNLEVVEKCFGAQCHSNVYGYGGGMKRKHFNDPSKTKMEELQAKLREKEEENLILKKQIEGIESRLEKIEYCIPPESVATKTSSSPTRSMNDANQHEG